MHRFILFSDLLCTAFKTFGKHWSKAVRSWLILFLLFESCFYYLRKWFFLKTFTNAPYKLLLYRERSNLMGLASVYLCPACTNSESIVVMITLKDFYKKCIFWVNYYLQHWYFYLQCFKNTWLCFYPYYFREMLQVCNIKRLNL